MTTPQQPPRKCLDIWLTVAIAAYALNLAGWLIAGLTYIIRNGPK